MFILVFNQSNIVQDGQNNKLVYRFPNSVLLTDKYISISNISMFYSWFNITNSTNNNKYSYTWVHGVTTNTYNITIPDGLYEIIALNDFLQFNFIENNTYWIASNGDYIYPFEFLVNVSRYAVQINTYLIPTSLPVGASIPVGFPGWPATTQNCTVTIPTALNQIIGYPINFTTNANVANAYVPPVPATASTNYATKNSIGTLSYLSSVAPQVQPNNTVLFSLSNINNPYSQPSSIIYSINPSVAVGQQISVSPPNFMWNKMIDGTYNELRLTLLGNNLQPLIINDPNMTFLLTIRDKDEAFLGSK